ncbi:MAG: vWA domain-containing protein [Halioglobus sp.]
MKKMFGLVKSLQKIVLLLVLVLSSAQALADAALGDGLRPDVRLLIDISGSMKDSDPENLRAPALDLIVRLLPEGAKAGVWIFGHDVQLLVEHRVVDAEWRESAARAVAEIDNSGLFTNIPAALKAAVYDLDRLDPSYRTSIILLTDGKVDVSESPMANARAASTVLGVDAPGLGAVGIQVHTIALSDEADWGFLDSLAKSTGGISEEAHTAERLTKIFYQSLEMVAPTSRIPVAGKTFQIDPSVHEFTALMFFDNVKAKTGLVGPDGKRYSPLIEEDGADWFRNRKFSLVTVVNPKPGEWKLIAPGGSETRVTVISDLRLEVDPLPNSLPSGKRSELGLRLRERGAVLNNPEVLSIFKLSVGIQGPAGEEQLIDVFAEYPVPDDGEFRVAIPALETPGRYTVTVRLQGETLERELPMYLEVVASAENSAISTRGDAVPEGSFTTPMISFAVLLGVITLVVAWFLNRRKKRKLEVWRRRNIELEVSGRGTGTQYRAVSGMRAPTEDEDPLS